MSTAVVYCSQTGYTEKYARWLAEELGTRAIPFAERGTAAVDAADTVVLLGWFHAGGLKGARWLRSLMDARPERRYVVVGVGAYPMPSDEWPRSETDAAVDKLAMRAFFRMQAKAAETDPRVAFALDAMREGFDGTRREYLQPVLEHLRSME